jgi:hypothetical protein
MKRKIVSLVLALVLAFSLAPAALAAVSDAALNGAVTGTAAYVCAATPAPQLGSIGGEWAVIGLARSGYSVPEPYFRDYYTRVEAYVKECGGVLHDKKYTEYSRVILALSAIGADARSVGGYDLTKPLGDYDKTVWQGLNGPVWALIALDSRDYPEPSSGVRQKYIDSILSCQLTDGGWSLLAGPGAADRSLAADPDITGMALQALAKYQSQPAVSKATDKALECMSKLQQADGGFSSMGEKNAESVVQMVVALAELGISQEDSRFVKNGASMLDALMAFRQTDGGFRHTEDGSGNSRMTTEQGLYALAAVQRQRGGKNSLYRMGDAVSLNFGSGGGAAAGAGLPGKHADVQKAAVSAPGTTFSDVKTHANKTAIEALAARKIINGMGDGTFAPNNNMTRAEFATIVVKALGLTAKANNVFTDVKAADWFAPYVGAANSYGIVNGVGDGKFNPNGTITRQEAAAMVARAARLCGMDTEYSAAAARDILSQFGDYTKCADWARGPLAFCYDNGILDASALNIQPTVTIRRCEIAQMLYNMLEKANLL